MRAVRHCLAAIVFLFATAQAAFAEGRWLRLESPHFIVYGVSTEARLREAIEDLESLDALLRLLLRIPAQADAAKLEVYLAHRTADLRSVRRWRDAVGFYAARPEIVGAFAIFRTSGFDAEEILFHEYAHHFMFQYFRGAYPAWYVEGFAEFIQTVKFQQRQLRLGEVSDVRAQWLMGESWLRMDEFLRGDFSDDGDLGRFYAQSWLTVHYLYNRSERMEGFGRYLTALQAGADPVDAFEPAFGVSTAQLHLELRRYARGRIPVQLIARPDAPTASVTVQRLPEAADELLPLAARMRMGVQDARDRAAIAAQVRRVAARFPDDAFALRALARAELMVGDFPRARALAGTLLAENGDDVEALYLMGASYAEEARTRPQAERAAIAARGRPFFAHAFRIDPRHVATLYRYVETFSHDAAPLPSNVLDVLIRAHLLAPQVADISLRTASELIRRDRFDEAITVLGPIAFAPHGGQAAQVAQRLLQTARRGRQAASDASAGRQRPP